MYTSSKQKFNTFSDGVTPHIGENGHWWFGTTDSGVVAEAQDGTSFSGVREYYLATLATAVTEDNPNAPEFDPDEQDEDYLKANWKTSVADTGYGTKNNSGVTYKYLWNVEVIESTKADGSKEVDITNPELMSVYLGGRIPEEYISYYCAQASSEAPTASLQPYLGTDNNSIVVPTESPWDTSLTVENDREDYLFEITFVKYKEKDEQGKNLYQKISGPTCIGHNSISPTFISLDNDSELLVRNSSGTILGTLPEVTAKLYINGSVDSTKTITLSAPDAFTANGSLISTFASFEDNKLKIEGIPPGFKSGDFTFSYSTYTKKFSLRVVDGEYDYDLIVDRTAINSSGAGGTFNVKVKKKQSGGTPTEITAPSDTLKLFVGDSQDEYDGTDSAIGAEAKWQFKYDRWQSTPIKISLKEKIGDNWFEWDTETVEFVVNGQSLKKLNTYSRTDLTEAQIRGTSDSEGYGEEGHIEWWWTQEKLADGTLGPKYDNEHIIVGDTVYLTGVTSDSKLEYTIYGVCLAKSENYDSGGTETSPRPAVQVETTSFIMGGATGQIALAPTRYFTGKYEEGSVVPSSSNADFNRKPQVGEVFSNVCNYGKQMVTFEITGVTATHWSAKALYAVSLVGPEGEKGITLELTNDQATIFVGNSGTIDPDLLQNATTTEVIVRAGNTPLTEGLTYSWSTSGTGNTLSSTNTSSTYFTALGTDTATAVVTVSVNDTVLGSKTFVVSKSKEGPTGPSGQNYRLGISPNSYNVAYDYNGTCEATLSVTKYEGTSVSGLIIGTDTGDGKDFRIKNVTNNNSWVDTSSISLSTTTTFQLIYKPGDKNIILDSETITIVRNGKNGQSIKGDTGNSAARVYYGDDFYYTADDLFDKKPVIDGSGNLINGWNVNKFEVSGTFIYSCDLTYNPNTTIYSNPEKPKLLEVTPPSDGISKEQWATFVTLTGNKEQQNTFFDNEGRMYINATLINTDSLVVNKDFSVAIKDNGTSNLLAADDLVIDTEGISQVSAREWTLRKSSNWSGAYVNPRILEVGKTYLLSYSFNVVSGTLKRIGGHHGTAEEKGFKFYQNSNDVTNSFFVTGGKYSSSYVLKDEHWDHVSGLVYKVAFLFTFKGGSGNNGVYIQPNRGIDDEITFNLWDVMLQEVDSIPNNLNDLVYMYPRGVAVTAGDVVTSINATPDGVAIKGDKINFSTANFVVTDSSNNIMFQATGGTQNPKVIVTHNRLFTVNDWLGYATKGVVTDWTAEQGKNGHIAVGDIAYLVGNTTDTNTVNGVSIPTNTPVRIYGRVIEITSNNIKMDMLGYKFGENLVDTYSTSSIQPAVSIAGWSVKPYGFLGPLQQYTLNGVSHNKPTIGFAPVPDHGCWAIWAGQQTGDGTGEGNKAYGHDAPFRVGHSGELYAENITLGTYKSFIPSNKITKDSGQTRYTYGGGTPELSGSEGAGCIDGDVLRVLFAIQKSNAEKFYRFVTPVSTQLYGLKKGIKYRFSGKVRWQHYWHTSWTTSGYGNSGSPAADIDSNGLAIRFEYYENGWQNNIIKLLGSSTDGTYEGSGEDLGGNVPSGDNWRDFEYEFTIPDRESVTGAYLSFQLHTKGEHWYAGWAWFKDLTLKEVYTPYSFGTIHPNTGLQFWSGPTEENMLKTNDKLIFRVNESGAYIKGEIVSSNATITGGSITIKNSDNEVVFNAGPNGVKIGGGALDDYATKGEIPSVAGLMSASTTGNYSWNFSPTTGVSMYKGSQSDTNKVFAVDSSGLEVTGTVNATYGSIGDWNISGSIWAEGDPQMTLFPGFGAYTNASQSVSFKAVSLDVTVDNGQPVVSTGYQQYITASVPWLYVAKAAYDTYTALSDERLKHDISEYDEQTERFFDALQPKRYKYNSEIISQRNHHGFIAQEVLSALKNAGLSSADFAGVCQDGYNTEGAGYWYLRRDEFVSLNTWQIQKLKPRMTQLEEKIILLEQRIAELEKN